MPEITVQIGGRDFDVVCKEGEEAFLQSAAAMLDTEAQALTGALGRIPESRMLLMAGLMLADKTASVEDQLATIERAKEKGPLASEVTAEITQLKKDLNAAQELLAGKEKELAGEQANTSHALQAMERMVVELEGKGGD